MSDTPMNHAERFSKLREEEKSQKREQEVEEGISNFFEAINLEATTAYIIELLSKKGNVDVLFDEENYGAPLDEQYDRRFFDLSFVKILNTKPVKIEKGVRGFIKREECDVKFFKSYDIAEALEEYINMIKKEYEKSEGDPEFREKLAYNLESNLEGIKRELTIWNRLHDE